MTANPVKSDIKANAQPGAQSGPRPQWYVAGTHSARESIAQVNLERQGFVTFAPRVKSLRRRGRRMEVRHAPLFPGYVFVAFDREHSPWRSINGTLGVRRLLGPDARPQPTPAGLVPDLMARCRAGVLEVQHFEAGGAVRILSGPFADRLAVVESLPAPDRVRVLLEIMGTAARFDLPIAELAAG